LTSLNLKSTIIDNLNDQVPAMMADLTGRVTIAPGDFESADSGSMGLAQRVAVLLDDCVLSSDIDAPYWACVWKGLTDDPWHALRTTKVERVKLSGWDNPRLDVRTVPVAQALANLTDEEFASVGDYVTQDDQEAFAEVSRLLEPEGPVVSMTLAFPEESVKLVFTLVRQGDEHAGVVALAVET
jgi:hypothetical protein